MADTKHIQITISDNSPEVIAAAKNAIYRALWAVGATAERHAKEDGDVPVDTGLLRNSITFAVGGESANASSYSADKPDKSGVLKSGKYPRSKAEEGTYVTIGSNVEYAIYQELGTSRGVKPKHFLKNAVADHTDEYKRIIEDSFKNV